MRAGRYYARGETTDDPETIPEGTPYFDLERIAQNAERLLRYEEDARGVFALPTSIVHPDTIRPAHWEAGSEEFALFQAIVACGDRRNRSEWVWRRARAYFAEHDIHDVPEWSDEERVRFALTINSGLRDRPDGGVNYDARAVYRTVQEHLSRRNGRARVDLPASLLAKKLERHPGVGDQVARAAAQWLGNAGYLEIDEAFVAKVDLHDIRYMLCTGELHLNGAIPHHKTLDAAAAHARKAATDTHELPIARVKKAVWALMRDVSSTYDRARGAGRKAHGIRILSTYPELWDNLDFWRRGKGHKVQRERGADQQTHLFADAELESPGTYLRLRRFPVERFQPHTQPGRHPLTPREYLTDNLYAAYRAEGVIDGPRSEQPQLISTD